ncbi:hypothetical protein NKR19_g3610 [Coniochaeta hoffmannii]|uniref:F-box domain-containing protein n=1 Tax=Coniochaeta hoffmannii TaxID=91930 RepID=A0AA38W193_9PEZI|nr:hypothetical protein NKR19_g3610 [Coniochaeta hoffmannii]
MGCMELRIDPEWAWEPRRGFLGLPRELRDVIYALVVIEPSKWERRHSALCDLCPRDMSTYERPVFDDGSTSKCATCRCKSRRNMGLLLANRQIHRETAAMFWSQNTFCFDTATQFGEEVGPKLRQEYLELLQHVSILRVTWQDYQMEWFWRQDRQRIDRGGAAMWHALLRCVGLRTVEMATENVFRPAHFDDRSPHDFTSFIPQLKKRLPNLQEFALAGLIVYDVNPMTSRFDTELDWCAAPPIAKRRLLYVKARKPLDLGKITTAIEVKEALRSFRTNFMVHVKFALETTLLGVDENDFSTDPNDPSASGYALVESLNDNDTFHKLKLRDDTVATVRLLGLPISQQTRIRHVKERWREDARRKSAGKPTVWEEKYKTVMQERQVAKREKRVVDASKEHQAYMEARQSRREETEARERKQKRRERVKERVSLARNEKLAQELREAERKRVRSPK